MKLSITLVCLLFAFIPKGYALSSCISCTSSSQALCTGSSVKCSGTNAVCTTIYTATKIELLSSTTYSLVRGCGQQSDCNQPKTLSNQFMTINSNTGCCTTDNCSTTEPTATTSTLQNGLECPSCFQLSSATCVPNSKITCTGDETRCTTYSMSSDSVPSKPLLAMAGCATQNLCTNYNGTTSTSTLGAIKINITCDNATVSATSTTITSSIHTSSQVENRTPHVTLKTESTKSSLATSTSHGATTKPTLLTSSPHEASQHVSTDLITRSTEVGRHTNDVSNSHFTTDIANPTPNNSSFTHYTTRITFTPTAIHTTTSEIVATTKCVCNGCSTHYSVFSLSLAVIVTLIKLLG